MPVLSNPKHERFAQELAKGATAEKSYDTAGYKPNRGNAATLKQNESILERVAELLAEREQLHGQSTARAIERVGLTKEWVLARLIENAERAMQASRPTGEDGEAAGDYQYQGSVANKALELLGKHLGLFIERHEHGNPGDFDSLSDADLETAVRDKAASLGLAKGASRTSH